MHSMLRINRGMSAPTVASRPCRALDGIRGMFGAAALGGILMFAGACDKPVVGAPLARPTNIAGRPTALFLVFGDRADSRALPFAVITGARVSPITLDSAGWHLFDRLYFQAGSALSAYRDGAPLVAGAVRRGMWNEGAPLYRLPACRSLRPLAALTLPADPRIPLTVELLATSVPLPLPAARPAPVAADLDSARAFAARAAQRAGLTRSARDELELVVQALPTGATDRPTLLASYVEKGGGGGAHPRHLFALADIGVDGYASTFAHAASDSAPEFRRLIDHLDLTGDGTDELLLEGWRQGGESFLVVMQFVGGRWHEVARGTNSWCADLKRRS